MRQILLYLTIFLNCAVAKAQTFDDTPRMGGFDYQWETFDRSNDKGLGAVTYEVDLSGVASFRHAPPVGVHPRIYFNPSDIPSIAANLKKTQSGQAISRQLHAYTTLLHLGQQAYDRKAAYAVDVNNVPLISNLGSTDVKPYYEKLLAGDTSVWMGASGRHIYMSGAIFAYEAFECLIYEGKTDPITGLSYKDRSRNLAKATAFWAKLSLNDPTISPQKPDKAGTPHLALVYDLAYKFMTDDERAIIRKMLAKVTPSVPRYGYKVAAYANTSNWTGLNTFELLTNLAIEGEEGYKPELTREWARTMHNFINYGWYSSGEGYEGLGKNYQMLTTQIVLARRGYSLLGHPHIRAFASKYLPALTQPFGKGFTGSDVWGGSGEHPTLGGYRFHVDDAVGAKAIFPNDLSVDFVWHTYIGSSVSLPTTGYIYQGITENSYHNRLITAAIFARDYKAGTVEEKATAGLKKLDYHSEEGGFAVLRSSFQESALAVQFHARQNTGGHTFANRNDFALSALGRIWIPRIYGGSEFQPTRFSSCMLIDDKGIGVAPQEGVKARQPARVIDYQSSENMSSITGDATYAYSWEWQWSPQSADKDHPKLGKEGWEKVTETHNDFQYKRLKLPHYDIPFYDFAAWNTPYKLERMVKRPYNVMEKAVRTLALVRGAKPFVLIADAYKKDAQPHNYKWVAHVAADLDIEKTIVEKKYRDIILKETNGKRRLLVRVLQDEGFDGKTLKAHIDTLTYVDDFTGKSFKPNPPSKRQKLIIESDCIEPQFKILLFPFNSGDPLPNTEWNNNHTELTVKITPSVSKRFSFTEVPPTDKFSTSGGIRIKIVD